MSRSQILFEEAQRFIPGGVNSPVRAFKSVGGTPPFIHHAKGPYLTDEDNRQFIDYVGSWGPMILGHNDADVVAKISEALQNGLSFGAPTKAEVMLAKRICELVPSVEQIRMVSSGTEATMTALRLARGYTQRDIIVKFEGCYHGHSDSLLIKAGSGALTMGQPSSPGVPKSLAQYTINLAYNHIDSLRQTFAAYGEQIAAVIVEPIAGNMNCVLPEKAFLQTLRELCDNYGTILIFDEVITGFRVALGGAQNLYGIAPDLTTFGKIIGGGMPVGALGGKKKIMQYLSPVGPVYQAGTLSGNPIAMTAGLATLDKLARPDFYLDLKKITDSLVTPLISLANQHDIPLVINSITGMFGIFFTKLSKVESFDDVMQSDVHLFNQFFHGMLAKGIYFGASAFESAFVSITHDPHCIAKTLEAAEQVFCKMKHSLTATV